MHRLLNYLALLLFNVSLLSSALAQEPLPLSDSMAMAQVRHNADSLLNSDWFISLTGYQKRDSTTILSVTTLEKPDRIRVHADKQLAYAPFREESIDSILAGLGKGLSAPFDRYQIELFSDRTNVRELVPNYHRSASRPVDKSRSPGQLKRKSPPLLVLRTQPGALGMAACKALSDC